jgi:hypothetical protein
MRDYFAHRHEHDPLNAMSTLRFISSSRWAGMDYAGSGTGLDRLNAGVKDLKALIPNATRKWQIMACCGTAVPSEASETPNYKANLPRKWFPAMVSMNQQRSRQARSEETSWRLSKRVDGCFFHHQLRPAINSLYFNVLACVNYCHFFETRWVAGVHVQPSEGLNISQASDDRGAHQDCSLHHNSHWHGYIKHLQCAAMNLTFNPR